MTLSFKIIYIILTNKILTSCDTQIIFLSLYKLPVNMHRQIVTNYNSH